MMPDTRIILSGLWMATMLTYLWGDVLVPLIGHTSGHCGAAVEVEREGAKGQDVLAGDYPQVPERAKSRPSTGSA